MSTGYQIYDQSGCYYLTFQVVAWADLFSRRVYRDIITASLNYCIAHKGLKVHAYVIMSNHLHLIVSAKDGNLSDIVRDFKRHTSKEVIKVIIQEVESRREWLLALFSSAAKKHKRNETYQVWTHENHAIELHSDKFIKQKLDYIHENPVRSGIVHREEDYVYSSACTYYNNKEGLITIDLLL